MGQGGTWVREGQKIIEKPLKFAVMADVHSDWENFKKALEIAKSDNTEFLIIAGDLTTLGKRSELFDAKEILDKSGLRYYVIPGNHDYWWSQRFNDKIFEEIFGEKYQSFKNGNVKFILIDNGNADLGLGETQKRWLEAELKECLQFYCLVFAHIPFNHPTSLHVMGESSASVASEAAELIRLFGQDEIKEIFAGHIHYSLSYEKEGLRTTIIVGAVTSNRNLQSPKFLEISLVNGSLTKKETFIAN